MSEIKLLTNDKFPYIAYEPNDGFICRVDPETKQFIRKMIPDDNGVINLFVDGVGYTKRKAIYIAYEVFNKHQVSDDCILYFKDTDLTNIKIYNIGVMSKADYSKYKDCFDNIINKRLRLTFAKGKHVVKYKLDGKMVSKSFDDSVIATRFKRSIYLDNIRVISNYYVNP